jgi:hypothetical protein
MTKTFKDLQEIDSLVGSLYKKNPTLEHSKFGYAYKRFSDKNYLPMVKDFQEELGNVRIDNALEDEKTKEILIDRMNVRGYKYSKEGLKKVILEEKAIIEKFDLKGIEIVPFISKVVPEDLTEDQSEMLKGVVLE